MPINKFVGNAIREFRKTAGKSQFDIGEYLHMSQSAYAKLETGETSVSTERIYKLCQYFDEPFTSFFPPLNNPKEDKRLRIVGDAVDKSIEGDFKYVQHLEAEIEFLRDILKKEALQRSKT